MTTYDSTSLHMEILLNVLHHTRNTFEAFSVLVLVADSEPIKNSSRRCLRCENFVSSRAHLHDVGSFFIWVSVSSSPLSKAEEWDKLTSSSRTEESSSFKATFFSLSKKKNSNRLLRSGRRQYFSPCFFFFLCVSPCCENSIFGSAGQPRIGKRRKKCAPQRYKC